jgi:hypothetical protein
MKQEELRPFLNSNNSSFVIQTDCVHSVIDMSLSDDVVQRTSLFRSKWILFENLNKMNSSQEKYQSSAAVRYDQRQLVVQNRKREKGRFVKKDVINV